MITSDMKRITTILFLSVLMISCAEVNKNDAQIKELQAELDSLKKLQSEQQSDITGQIATFLTFQKEDAEEAINFYLSLFDNSSIINVKRWEAGAPGKEGTIMLATFRLNDQLFMCSDSPPIHEWDFTPAVSNYVECIDEIQLERLFAALSENGQVMMPLNNYGFSQKFGFVEDRFGVSWQLNLQ